MEFERKAQHRQAANLGNCRRGEMKKRKKENHAFQVREVNVFSNTG